MKHLVEFEVGDGQTILVEVEDVGDGQEKKLKPIAKPPGKIAAQAAKTFEQAMGTLEPMIKSVKSSLDKLTDPADEVEVKFSVKLNSQVGAVVTTVGGEATYEITLKWAKK
ncbi:MAG: CU044_2847 family protein [Planktothrix sp.]